jgi:hypothetical protein
MSTPGERFRALVKTRQLLLDLADPEVTPGVPVTVRESARHVLRHYPLPGVFWALAARCPEWLAPAPRASDST